MQTDVLTVRRDSIGAELRGALGEGIVFGLDLLQILDDLLHVEHVGARLFLLFSAPLFNRSSTATMYKSVQTHV